MNFACPSCEDKVELNQRSCAKCGLRLTLGSIVRCYWQKIVKSARVKCPTCGYGVPIASPACPSCKTSLTIGSAVDSVVEPPKKRLFAWAENSTPETRRWVQRMHFLFSLAVVWWMLILVEDRFGGRWWTHSAIAAVFLTASGLVAAIIVPKALIKIIVDRTSATTKLALICNYLSIMLAMRMFTTTWKERAFSLAGIILATGVAGWFLTNIAWPVKENVATLFKEEEEPTRFDPSGPQGRKGRRE